MNPLFFARFLTILISISSFLFAKYELSICAIFQNEAPYLKEWIEFHKLQGVQHFYLYNNNSEDNYLEVLEPYVFKNEATLVEWPFTYEHGDHPQWIKIQSDAYMDCIKQYGHKTRWLAVIDIDEFLFCPDGILLPVFLKKYRQYGGLCVNWIKFGTSNVEEIPPQFCMIELLTHCSNYDDEDNRFIKSIVQPKYVKSCSSPHYFIYKNMKYAVDVDQMKTQGLWSENIRLDQIRINHYWTRTINYFLDKKINSRQKRRPWYLTERLLQMAENCNLCIDTAILRYVDPLRTSMKFSTELNNVP